MNRKKGKEAERLVARTLGGERTKVMGVPAPDVIAGNFAIEVRRREGRMRELQKHWRDAKRVCPEDREPALVLIFGRECEPLFIISLKQAKEWLGLKKEIE